MALTGTIILALGPLALLLTWLLGEGGLFLLLAMIAAIVAGEFFYRFATDRFPLPYLGFLLSPLLLINYSAVGDFRIRLACFFMLIYIFSAAYRNPVRKLTWSLKKTNLCGVWVLSFLIFALTAIALYTQGIHLSGDEPHYVMIAQSLVEDGDLDLKNNIENKTYFAYLPVEIRFHGSVWQGKYHSFHMPGMSFLLVPFYYVFKLLGGIIPGNLFFRLAAALINAFFALGLFLAFQAATEKKNGTGTFIFFLLTFPLLFHAVHLFPELPAATLIIFAYIFGRDKKQYFLSGLLLAFIPWLHLKYSIPVLILTLFLIARIWREIRGNDSRLKQMIRLLITPALSLTLLGLYSKLLYGSFDPRAISPEKYFFAIPLKFKIETLLSFFMDQRDGILVYAPIFLLVFLVFKKKIRSSIRDFTMLAAMALAYILFHAFSTVRGGYSPAARPLIFVLWIMAVFLTAYYRQAEEMGKTLFRLLAGLTVFVTVWFFYYPLFLYQPVTREVTQRASGLLAFMGSEAVWLSTIFPSFLKISNSTYTANWIWLGALAFTFAVYYMTGTKTKIFKAARFLYPATGTVMLVLVCLFPHVQLQTRYATAGLSFFCNSKNFSYNRDSSAFRVLAGSDYDLFFELKGSATDKLDLLLLNKEGVTLKVKNGTTTLLEESRAPENRLNLRLSVLNSFRMGKKNLVHLGLESKAGNGTTFFWLKFR